MTKRCFPEYGTLRRDGLRRAMMKYSLANNLLMRKQSAVSTEISYARPHLWEA